MLRYGLDRIRLEVIDGSSRIQIRINLPSSHNSFPPCAGSAGSLSYSDHSRLRRLAVGGDSESGLSERTRRGKAFDAERALVEELTKRLQFVFPVKELIEYQHRPRLDEGSQFSQHEGRGTVKVRIQGFSALGHETSVRRTDN